MRLFIATAALLAFTSVPLLAQADSDTGNRYDLDRRYAAEISASQAYLETLVHRDHAKGHKGQGRSHAVIIDVRTVEEYVGGHPPNAYSIPFPHIYNRQNDPLKGDYIGQDPDDFVAGVDALDLPKDTLIITMCRTGFRSVLAGNLLADAGYTNVRNMWEGFKGNTKLNTSGDEADLDGDGEVKTDPYSGDLDGWANFGGLPVSYKLKHWRLYQPYMDLYYNVEGER